MKGCLSHELDVRLPADEVWEVYGTLRLAELVVKLVPYISKVDVEQGDGGVGTVLRMTLSGVPGMTYYKEKFIKVDNERRMKEALGVEGGHLDMGFTSYLVRFEILGKGEDSSIIRSTIEYELEEEHAANASLVTTGAVATIAEAVSKYLVEKKGEKA